MAPILARLLLDAQSEFSAAADAVPEAARQAARPGFNTPAWLVAHAAFFLDVWLNVDAQSRAIDACDPWLAHWFERQRAAGETRVETDFVEARAALARTTERVASTVASLAEADLATVPHNVEQNGWPAGTSTGYLVARAVAHVFAHAADLNAIAVAAGEPDRGLPGRLPETSGS